MFDNKNDVAALFAAYKILEEQNLEFVNHGGFHSLEAFCYGMQGFWVFVPSEEPKFIPKQIVDGLSRYAIKAEAVSLAKPSEPEPAPATPKVQPRVATSWEDPEIQRRLNDIVGEVQSLDTRYVRVISKSKAGKQTTLARIAQGMPADSVVKIIMHARRKTKERTVMAEVLKKNLKRTMARSFPVELVNA